MNACTVTETITSCPFNPVLQRDSDGDDCRDINELGANQVTGGSRNPFLPWDFADMWVPSLPNPAATKNRAITIADAVAQLAWIGSFAGGPPNANGLDYDLDLNGNLLADGAEYDRTASTAPGQPWRTNGPNGAVTIADVLNVLNSIGHNCA